MHRKKKYTLILTWIILQSFFTFFGCKNEKKNAEIHDIILRDDSQIKNEKAKKWFEKGLWYVEHQKYETAKDCFIAADKAYPNAPIILNAIGNAKLRAEGADSTSQYFERALKLDSDFIKTYANYGFCLNWMKHYEEAKKILYLGLRRNPEHLNKIDRSVLYFNLATSYYLLGDYQISLTLLDSAKQGLPEEGLYNNIMDLKIKVLSESRIKK